MGQQQLLLLVLSTVIVGLATVAGIQAFSENQAQATQDALTQKGVTIASDVRGLASKPQQLGGVDTSSSGDSVSEIYSALGHSSDNLKTHYDGSGDAIPAQGAGSDATCQINKDPVEIECKAPDSPQIVTVSFNGEDVATDYSEPSSSTE
jgi:hypothetical protein